MRPWGVISAAAGLVFALGCWSAAGAAERAVESTEVAVPIVKGTTGEDFAPGGVASIHLEPAVVPDPCYLPEVVASPTRPNWSTGAATTQCGVLEADFGWLWQPMGAGVAQAMQPSSLRFGLTPRMDLRWGLPGRVTQSGGASPKVGGVTDQWISVRHRFHEQGPKSPALALSYGAKIPTASPRKGFGSGYTDHQLILIGSRDFGRAHLDFNTVGTVAGCPNGHDGAAQFGLVLSVQSTRRLAVMLESDGGSQPGTSDRYGAALIGAAWNLKRWVVLDAAYTRAYTAGTPRQQLTVGFTCARRRGRLPLPAARFARVLGG